MFRNYQQVSGSGSSRAERRIRTIFLVAESSQDFIRLAPLYHALGCRMESYRPLIVRTDFHREGDNLDVLFEQLELPKADVCLMTGPETGESRTGEAFVEAERAMRELTPDMVVVFGDGDAAMAVTISATKLRVPVAHIDAGLRSTDWNMPREVNRAVMDRISTLLLTSSEDANINLLREGVAEESIQFVGNIMVDSLRKLLADSGDRSVLKGLDLQKQPYSLVAIRNPETAGDADGVTRVTSIIDGLASLSPLVLSIPESIRSRLLEPGPVGYDASVYASPRIRLIESPAYPDLLRLEKGAAVIVTDSEMVQEEATYLGVPCLTIAPATERPVTITDGTNILIGLIPDRVVRFAQEFLEEGLSERRMPLMWDGRAAERVVSAIDTYFVEAPAPSHATAAIGAQIAGSSR